MPFSHSFTPHRWHHHHFTKIIITKMPPHKMPPRTMPPSHSFKPHHNPRHHNFGQLWLSCKLEVKGSCWRPFGPAWLHALWALRLCVRRNSAVIGYCVSVHQEIHECDDDAGTGGKKWPFWNEMQLQPPVRLNPKLEGAAGNVIMMHPRICGCLLRVMHQDTLTIETN